MRISPLLLALLTTAVLAVSLPPAGAATTIVAASPDLADIAKRVGGNRVTVSSIARGNQDLHMLEPRPSDVLRVKRAHLVVRVGLGLGLWMDALLNAAGNRRVTRGGPGTWTLRSASADWRCPGSRSPAPPAISTSTATPTTGSTR